MLALDAARPGRVMDAHDVAEQAASVGRPVQVQTATDWLRREARDPHGAVVRVAKLRYVRRTGPGIGSLSAADRVASVAVEVHAAGCADFSVQELVAHLRNGGTELAPSTVSGAVRQLATGENPTLERTRWGRYRVIGGLPARPAEAPAASPPGGREFRH